MSDTDAIWVGWTIGLILGLIIGCLLGGGRKRDQAEMKKLSSSPHQSHPNEISGFSSQILLRVGVMVVVEVISLNPTSPTGLEWFISGLEGLQLRARG
ncbi:hypothetical protein HYC85_008676 [Camellia sinensis]|uniref:Uncharacterized protein n=1 Tax=Camellia sinensis TaxID=4442 RepID=A0A7J7HSJ1_CAMSI|nr:hypothetical protein HYC85_008676 [Camellia sinensis]